MTPVKLTPVGVLPSASPAVCVLSQIRVPILPNNIGIIATRVASHSPRDVAPFVSKFVTRAMMSRTLDVRASFATAALVH